MWGAEPHRAGGHAKFFLICLSHDDLANHIKTKFSLMHHHNFTLTEIDNMLPWEKEVYIILLADWLKAEAERKQSQAQQG